ncbi:SusC/RagA family TonB-linked outer membrane protein [Tamlana sp. I1]|uniref:SusC/RagA family TonB-linked outer membrane protein n=1 Tax=Tamlana sp. I1 TaxID=2762061 RepID=UPI0018904CEC|nr:TonB-dependent receptor [Tamlana sp. I1]
MKSKSLLQKCFKHFGALLVFFLLNTLNAQQGTTITGVITDSETNMPLPGVNVIEKGTKNGTSTDFDGNYSLTVSSSASVIEFSYVGYKTQDISASGKTTISIVMESDAQALKEVVIVGYGTVKKTDLTGTVATVDSEIINERNATNPLEGLQGTVAGVQVTSNTGRAGDGFDIVIRGNNSLLLDSKPLFVVDGVPTDNIDFLNPQDIARMDILKDASSAAIYGSRGSNGVVIVTTKNGTTAKSGVTVSLDTYSGIKNVARMPKLMSSDRWWYYHQSAYMATTNGGDSMNTSPAELENSYIGASNPVLKSRVEAGNDYDWAGAVLKSGVQNNTYLSVAGRADNGLNYNIGLGYQKETGNIANEELDKYSFKAAVNHKINEKFSTGANITVTLTEEQLGSDIAMQEAFRMNPFQSPWAIDANGNEIEGEMVLQPGKLLYPDGSWAINKTSSINPLLEIVNSSDEIRRWQTVGNVFFQYSPLEWLSFKTTYSAGLEDYRRGKSWGALTETGSKNGNLPSAELIQDSNFNYTWDNQMNIDFDLEDGDHTFNFLALQSFYSDRYETSFMSSQRMPFDTGYHNVGSGLQSSYNLGSGFSKRTLNSYALRLNYGYKGRYLVTLSNRWDGSSVFAEGNKWASFPSAALAWRMSEESFMADSNFFSNLKLRASYGYTGNNNIDSYSTLNALDRQTYYDYNGTTANGWMPSDLANSDVTWEKTREFNVGLDFGFLKNRIVGSVDVYDRLSDDLLFPQALPLESGWPTTIANVGSVSNKGVEVLLTTRNIQTNNVSWETTFTFTKNTNKLVSIYDQDQVDDVGNNLFIGESLNSHYNYQFDGIWQADEATEAASYNQTPGQAKVKDINNDGVINANDDRIILGNSDPDWSGSLTSRLTVGNIDFTVSAITNQGVLVYSGFHQNFTDMRDRGRPKLDVADWYIPENTSGITPMASNSYPQPRNGGTYWRNDGVGYYKDASFVKIKNITLGYTLSDRIVDKLKIKSLRVYGNVLNPFVFTDYEGYDPEWAAAGFNVARVGSVTYQLGLSLKF